MVMGAPDVLAGRYERRGVLGRGGMGTVYDAWDRRLERAVALKVLRPEMATDLTVRARFEAEARAAATLNHPHVVAVYDSGEDEGTAFLVMERLPGHTLRHEIARGPLSPGRLRMLLGDVLAALGAAHDAGIIHRDIKPGNVLFAADGSTKVADFGIAKSVGVDLTGTGELVGTTAYLAPERLDGQPASAASDLYAVGVLAYEALTGRKPFQADTPLGMARAIAEAPPPPLEASGIDVDPAMAAVIERALQKRPEDRFTTAAAMTSALGLSARPAPASPPPLPQPEPEPEPEPVVEAPAPPVEAPVVEEPVVEEPVVEDTVVEAPMAEPPVADEPDVLPETALFEPTQVDRTEVAPVPGPYTPPAEPEAEAEAEADAAPAVAPEPEAEPEPLEEAPREARGIGLIAAAAAMIVIAIAVGVAMTRGGDSKPKLATKAAAPTTSTTAEPPLADVALKDLLPVVRTLNTGLALRAFAANRSPILEITDVEQVIKASSAPEDDRALYAAHPLKALGAVAWANRPSANTEILLQVLKFATPADAAAARARYRQQEESRLEGLAQRMQDRRFESETHPTLGNLEVVRYFDPRGGRVQNGKATPANVTRHRGIKGQYVLVVVTRQSAGSDRNPTPPVVDPAPSVAEVLSRLSDVIDAKLNPQVNP